MEISERVRARLAVLSAHLMSGDFFESGSPAIERWSTSADITVPPHGSLKGALTIVDERTGKKYQVQVSDDGTVKAVDLKKISTGKEDKGLKLYDPGYLNTAPVRSSISYIDGDEGILRYRGYPIEEMAEKSTFLEVAYLLMYGNLPSESQLSDWEFAVSQHSAVPQGVLMEISERVRARVAVISAHLMSGDFFESGSPAIERWTTSADITVPPHGSLKGALTIVDERTGKKYQVQVSDDGTVKAVDLKKISTGKEDKGLKLYDPGYLNTAPVRSSISYIDGDEGILRYRGYPIEEMAEKSTFLEVAYLLMYGNLPSESQLSDWEFAVSQHSAVPQGVLDIIQSMPHDAHPMGVLVSAMSALSIFHPDANPALRGQDIYDSKQVRDKQIIRIIGKAPTIAAAAYLRMAGRPPVLPSGSLSYAENFLYMLDSMGNRSYKPNPRLARVLDILFILHAEHEMNCSTAAARHLASSGVDVYTAVAGAVGALYGPLHGGANEAVLKMLSEIGSVENIPEFIEGVKNRKRKMSGFGHRVYKNYDPRAKVIKKLADEVFSIVGRDPLIEVAVALEKAALSDDYFVKRKLYPNVDFYSGLIYRAMGFPPEFFTVLFAIPRMAGYLSHWKESLDDPDTKIMRPQQVYTGVWLRHYTPVRERVVTDESKESDKLGQVSTSNASRRRLAGSSA